MAVDRWVRSESTYFYKSFAASEPPSYQFQEHIPLLHFRAHRQDVAQEKERN